MTKARNALPSGVGSKEVTYEGILQGLSVYWVTGEMHEVRHLRGDVTAFRRFETPEAAAKYIFFLARQRHQADNFYLTINAVKRGVQIDRATCDHHIGHRHRLVLDVDPDPGLRKVNGQKVSATEVELTGVRLCAITVISKLREEFGWPEPIVIMSGYHLAYEIDLPADDSSKRLLARVLKAINARYGIAGVAEIDTSVFNASRIIKIPGTIARKGIHSLERPHRCCPEELTPPCIRIPVAIGRMKQRVYLSERRQSRPRAAWKPTEDSRQKRWTRDRFIQFLDQTGIGYRDSVPFEGGEKFVLNSCPFGPHRKITACVFWSADGRVGFDCKESPSCDRYGWADFHRKFSHLVGRKRAADASCAGREVVSDIEGRNCKIIAGDLTRLSWTDGGSRGSKYRNTS